MSIAFISFIAKIAVLISRLFNIGSGGTWSGEIALKLDKNIIQKLFSKLDKSILVAGTNGKTTTSKIIRHLLKEKNLVYNDSGANLENGIVSAFIKRKGKIGIFEIDEAVLPNVLAKITPDIIILLNLFRDQLDRYGEVNIIAEKWRQALKKLPPTITIILNADDPQIAFLAKKTKAKTVYFGRLKGGKTVGEKWGDSFYCPNCREKLNYQSYSFSHLGNYSCPKCLFKRPKLDLDLNSLKIPLEGEYNLYNAAAAFLALKQAENLSLNDYLKNLSFFKPAFGRGETIKLNIKNPHLAKALRGKQESKSIKILLSKNPTGLSENIKVVSEDKKVGAVLLVLNDRIPDGRDISWIWDVDFEPLVKNSQVIIASGDRAYDMGMRIKYQFSPPKTADRPLDEKLKIINELRKAIELGLKETKTDEIFYILPTYSAMLEVRKILLGRKIL